MIGVVWMLPVAPRPAIDRDQFGVREPTVASEIRSSAAWLRLPVTSPPWVVQSPPPGEVAAQVPAAPAGENGTAATIRAATSKILRRLRFIKAPKALVRFRTLIRQFVSKGPVPPRARLAIMP